MFGWDGIQSEVNRWTGWRAIPEAAAATNRDAARIRRFVVGSVVVSIAVFTFVPIAAVLLH